MRVVAADTGGVLGAVATGDAAGPARAASACARPAGWPAGRPAGPGQAASAQTHCAPGGRDRRSPGTTMAAAGSIAFSNQIDSFDRLLVAVLYYHCHTNQINDSIRLDTP